MKTIGQGLICLCVMVLIGVCSLEGAPLENVASLKWNESSSSYDLICGATKIRVIFYKDDIFRVWVAPKGDFTEPQDPKVVVYNEAGIAPQPGLSDQETYYKIETAECVLRINKNPCTFALYRKDNATPVFEEQSPLDIGTSAATQTLKLLKNDYFYGCGMYNGHFCHNGNTVPIKLAPVSLAAYDIGANPNPAPFYCSLKGYGAYRNTWEPGSYAFHDPVVTSHHEPRFDCYYFYGPDLKKVLNNYTLVTGRPFMPPVWGLGLGLAGEYTGKSGHGIAPEVAAAFRDRNFPLGWILPNDSYSADFTQIPKYVPQLTEMGIVTGMWMGRGAMEQNQMSTIIEDWGVRLIKCDNSWVSRGYQGCFHALELVGANSIEKYSDGRAFLHTTAGWAGTQRLAVQWTGDSSITWEWLKWHCPTIIGCAMSAQNGATFDLGGEVGEGEEPYVRCFQWHCWLPYSNIMNHWSPVDKLPWLHAPKYADLLASNMRFKTRLTAYLYTLCHQAYETGIAVQRPCLLEFPNDPKTWAQSDIDDYLTPQQFDYLNSHQFMCGPSFLVRPVFENLTRTDMISLYLPANENWIDFYTGSVIPGGKRIKAYAGGFAISGQKIQIPVFVREGAVVPLWPEQYYDTSGKLQRPIDPLTIDVYPHQKSVTSFEYYEDDLMTREYKTGKFSKTLISSDATQWTSSKRFDLQIGKALGDYTGKPPSKTYIASVHLGLIDKNKPLKVYIDGAEVSPRKSSADVLGSSASGWCYDANDRKGILWVKTSSLATNEGHRISTVSDCLTKE